MIKISYHGLEPVHIGFKRHSPRCFTTKSDKLANYSETDNLKIFSTKNRFLKVS